jgi:hypothetical protein
MEAMYRPLKIFLPAVLLISVVAIIAPLRADVVDSYCYLEATHKDTFVMVWTEDRQGNKGRKIWQGVVKAGQRVKISSPLDAIRYSASVYVDQRDALSGDQSRWCSNASTIGVP